MELAKKPQAKAHTTFMGRLLSASPDQAKDTGMAMVLICLLLAYWWEMPRFLPAGLALLLVNMVYPKAFTPVATLWFGLANFMGRIVSTIILSVLFFVLVTPVGLIRRLMGADALQLKKWKNGKDSVFVVRSDLIQGKDLENPY
jgi:hypothetical protein